MKKLKILLTNDDGIESKGFRLLARKLSKNHEVYVFAPHIQRSACSSALTVYAPFSYREVQIEDIGITYAVEGTPADCVKFAVKYFNIPFDLVVSGPNFGSNLGTDILYSGTVGGATEGAVLGLQALSFSQVLPIDSFEYCTDYIAANLEKFIAFRKQGVLLNVNFPPAQSYKGIKVAKQGVMLYTDYYDKNSIDGVTVYQLKGDWEKEKSATEGTDIISIDEGYISVTPIALDRTDYSVLDALTEIMKA